MSWAVRVKGSTHRRVTLNILLPAKRICSPKYQFSHITMATASEDVPINHMRAEGSEAADERLTDCSSFGVFTPKLMADRCCCAGNNQTRSLLRSPEKFPPACPFQQNQAGASPLQEMQKHTLHLLQTDFKVPQQSRRLSPSMGRRHFAGKHVSPGPTLFICRFNVSGKLELRCEYVGVELPMHVNKLSI